jgi:hypothetical protein
LLLGKIYIGTKALILLLIFVFCDRLCGLVGRVLGYRSRGPGLIPDTTRFLKKKKKKKERKKTIMGLERGPLSLMSTTV